MSLRNSILLLELEPKRLDFLVFPLELEPERQDFFVPHVEKRNNAKKVETTQEQQ